MAQKKKTAQKPAQKKAVSKKSARSTARKLSFFRRIQERIKNLLSRRPHRSFRRTRRRDYIRSLKLPGYWAFTAHVGRVMRENRRQLLILGAVYVVMSLVLLGLGSQESFTALRENLNEASDYLAEGNWSEMGKASLLAVSTIAGSISPTLNEAQQLYAVILGLLLWLSIVWLLRQRLAKGTVKVRDALYNAGAPIIPTALLFVVLLLQLLPIALAVIGYSAAQTSGLLAGGVEAMLFWAAAAGLATLSLYWVTSTLLALVIITLPGMYPMQALKIAGDMVIGRRLRILFRILWAILIVAVSWIVVLIPVIMVDAGLKAWLPAVEWLPIVPIAVMIVSSMSFMWLASYCYLLYRRIVDDDAKPA